MNLVDDLNIEKIRKYLNDIDSQYKLTNIYPVNFHFWSNDATTDQFNDFLNSYSIEPLKRAFFGDLQLSVTCSSELKEDIETYFSNLDGTPSKYKTFNSLRGIGYNGGGIYKQYNINNLLFDHIRYSTTFCQSYSYIFTGYILEIS